MSTNSDQLDLEHELLQWLTRELVRGAMESPLREAILDAVEEATDEAAITRSDSSSTDGETADPGEKSRIVRAAQGFIVFMVMFVVLYVSLRRLTSDEET